VSDAAERTTIFPCFLRYTEIVVRERCVVIAGAVLTLSPLALAADSNSLVGIHFWGDRHDSTPATMLNSQAPGVGGWD
jgi:hypothetical protein